MGEMGRRENGRRGAGGRRSAIAALGVAIALIATGSASGASRGFELVSPPDAEGYDVNYVGQDTGGHVYYRTAYGSPLGAQPDGFIPDVFGATRSASGWAGTWLMPFCVGSTSVIASTAGCATDGTAVESAAAVLAARDGVLSLLTTEAIDPTDLNGGNDVYRSDATGATLVTASDGGGTPAGTPALISAQTSTDLSTTGFVTTRQLLPADTDSLQDLYAVVDGTLRLISATPGGTTAACPSSCTVNLPVTDATVTATERDRWNAVSGDGRRIFFETKKQLVPADTDNAVDVYGWDDGTIHVLSDKPGGGAAATATAQFRWAAADGSRVFFQSGESLLPADVDTAVDVYSVNPDGSDLQLVSPGTLNAPAALQYVSPDGSHALFTTTEALTAGAPAAGSKLYAISGGAPTYLGSAAGFIPSNAGQRQFAGTPDGSTMVFQTTDQLTPDDTNGVADVYELQGGAVITLVSKRPAGADTSDAYLGGDDNYGAGVTLHRVLSDDGSQVFFSTADSLVPQDTDGGRVDVYAGGGGADATLVSAPGSAQDDDVFETASPSGADVLLWTHQPLVGADADGGQADIYDARVGGGFAEAPSSGGVGGPAAAAGPASVPATTPATTAPQPPAPPPPVVAPSAPPVGGPGTASSSTPKVTATAGRSAHVTRGRVVISVRVSVPGQLAVQLVVRSGGRTVVIGQASSTYGTAGSRSIAITLTRTGKAQLAAHPHLAATARLTFDPKTGRTVRSSRVVRTTATTGSEGHDA
jgi:hypothetical protein